MHKLLERQIEIASRQTPEGAPDVGPLLAAIDQTYHEFERERRLNNRAAKLMEEELREANRQAERKHDAVWTAILDNASDGMLLVNDDGVVDAANRAAEKQFAAGRGDLAGKPLHVLMALDAATQVTAQTHEIWGVQETSGYALDGQIFPLEFSVSALETAGRRCRLWIVRDISERMRNQRQLLESQLRFQDFAEASSDCFWEIDASLSRPSARSPQREILAKLIVRLLTMPDDGATPDGVPTESWSDLHRHLRAQRLFRDLQIAAEWDDGETRHISLSGKPVFDLEGKFCGYRGTGRDLSREVEAEAAANRAERRLLDAMDSSSSAIAIVDSCLKLIAGNSALKALAPARSDQLRAGRPLPVFLGHALGKWDGLARNSLTPASFLRTLIVSGEAHQIMLGNTWYLATARPLTEGGAVLTFSDITTIKQHERELAEAKQAAESANRLKSQFLATMSHELRTPLNAILGFSEVIRDNVFGKTAECWQKYSSYAGLIHSSGKHLLSLISEILDLSKIEAGNYVLDLRPVDLREIVTSAMAIIAPAAEKSNVAVTCNLPDRAIPLSADDRAIRQIALNLLSNAVKFTPAGGRVHVDLIAADETAVLTITDTGIGIAKEHLEAVFEPFRQVDASISRRHEGTGLGLAISKRLVEMHGGTIQIASEVGAGTILSLCFPMLMAELQDADPCPQQPSTKVYTRNHAAA